MNHHPPSNNNSGVVLLPPGWIEARDPNSGQIYYANPTTKESSWEIPTITTTATPTANVRPSESTSNNNHISHNNNNNYYSRMIQSARELTVQQAAHNNNNNNNPHQNNTSHYNQYPSSLSSSYKSDLELQSISPGQLADLVQIMKHHHHQRTIQQQNYAPNNKASGDGTSYTAINPYSLPDQWYQGEDEELLFLDQNNNNSTTDPAKKTSLDSKMDTLLEQLKEFGYRSKREEPQLLL